MAVLLYDEWNPQERRWIENTVDGDLEALEEQARELRKQKLRNVRFVRVSSRHPGRLSRVQE